MIVGVDHVQLAIPAGAEDEAVRFYGGLLGLVQVPKPPELARRGGCWFEGDGVRVHLGIDDPFVPARKAHPGFVVRDLDALVDRFIAAGVEVEEAEVLDWHRRVHVHDPFGNRIELIEY